MSDILRFAQNEQADVAKQYLILSLFYDPMWDTITKAELHGSVLAIVFCQASVKV